jgi:hypothetical protein
MSAVPSHQPTHVGVTHPLPLSGLSLRVVDLPLVSEGELTFHT